MFRLYYFFNLDSASLIFENNDLGPCLAFIRHNHYVPTRCTIISPNNRRITFDVNNDLVFAGLN